MLRSTIHSLPGSRKVAFRTATILACAYAPLASGQIDPNDDAFMLCPAYDHETFKNLIAWQAPPPPNGTEDMQAIPQKLWVAHLDSEPDPTDIRTETVFDILPPDPLDENLAPLNQSLNGPEIGRDMNAGFELVYTKEQDPLTHNYWYMARQANDCLPFFPQNWIACWDSEEYTNPNNNRWGPFVTQTNNQNAKIVYFYDPGLRGETTRRIAFRELEPSSPTEIVINDASITSFAHWGRYLNQDYIITTRTEGSNRQVVLYDGTAPLSGSETVSTGDGDRNGPWIALDPNSGEYTVADVKTATDGSTSIEVWHRTDLGQWLLRYEITAESAGETDDDLVHVQSAEPFIYSGRLYLVFVTSNEPDFRTTTKGHIWIVRIEEDTDPTIYKLLNDPSEDAKRTEPEIHYPDNDSPAIFYSRGTTSEEECPGYPVGTNALWRARTDL